MTFLILQAGTPVAPLRRHGGFPHWIRVAAGLGADDAVAVDIASGPPPDTRGFVGAIITGSAAMVSHREDWSERAAGWLRGAADAGLPLFGICYGHQLLAHALGGRVDDHPHGREMGTIQVDVLPAAAGDPLFDGLPDRFAAHATHLQTVLESPPGATVLARSAHDACQAFRWRDAAWGVQFHPEFSATHMRGYVHARRAALIAEGHDPGGMSRNITATPQARRLMRRFVAFARQRPLR
ncbi:MAG TPA: glutamine amidotransferase [Xanthomonadaceae bacterium]|nr:glutamine amidotransferase [Xanthomonadaceae bacterium]